MPRGIQIEALFEMARAWEEGIEKSLLVSATGSGKTLTSFKTAQLASALPYIDGSI